MKRLFTILLLGLFLSLEGFAQNPPSECPNLDAEFGTFANWQGGLGSCCPINIVGTALSIGRHTIVGPNGFDPKIPNTGGNVAIPLVPPGGGLHAIRLGNDNDGSEAEQLSYTITVTPQTALFIYRYAVIFQDPNHSPAEQPRFQISMKDGNGQNILCGQYDVFASAGIQGFRQYTHPTDDLLRYKPWSTVGIDLTPYMGQNVKITFRTGDCSLGAHYGYAYIDCYCSPLEIENAFCPNATSVPLTAPEGFQSYVWSTGETTRQIIITNPSLGGQYSVTMTSIVGCSVTLTTTVASTSVLADFVPAVTCQNDARFNDRSSGFNGTPIKWSWDFGDSTPLDTAQNPVHVYADPGQYNVTLIATSNRNCADTITLPVTIFPAPQARALVDPICETKDAVFTDSSTVLYGNIVSWYWTFGDGNISSVPSPVHNYPFAGTYPIELIITSDLQCTDTFNVDLVVNPTPLFSAGIDTAVCGGSIVDIGALGNPFYNYTWSPTVGVQDPAAGRTQVIIPQVFDFARNNEYLLTGIDPSTGCINYDTVNVLSKVIPPAAFVTPPPQCFRDHSFAMDAIQGPFGTEYEWTLDPTSSLQSANTQSTVPFTFTVPGLHPVQLITKLDGCSDTLVDSITVYEQPVLDIEPEVTEGCPPLTVTFANNSTGPNPSFQWNFSDGTTTNDSAGTHVFTDAGTYTLWVTMITPEGCTDTKSFPNFVRVLPRPVSAFTVDSTEVSILNARINVYDESRGASFYRYDFGDGQSAEARFASHMYQDTGYFDIQYVVANNFGCTDTSKIPIKVEPYFTFYVPNSFTPNGDGVNDYFQGFGRHFTDYELRIFNRWGREIYLTNDYNKPWDGRYGGDMSQNDVYEYRIVVKDLDQKSYTYIGHVVLVK